MFASEAKKIADELKYLHKELFEASQKSRKEEIKNQIEAMEWELIEATLKEQDKTSSLKELEQYKISNTRPFFLWKLHFGEAFQDKGGFDVVIANPPYVGHEGIKSIKPQLAKAYGDFYCGTADLYTYFYKCGVDLLRTDGHLCFISPNKFMRAGYGKNMRVFLTTQAIPKTIIDFGKLPVFEAGTDPSILLLEKGDPQNKNLMAATIKTTEEIEDLVNVIQQRSFEIQVSDLKRDCWTLERPRVLALIEKLKTIGKPLGEYVQDRFYYGIKTGLNEGFVIDAATRKKLISEDPKSAESIRPWLRGRDIRKWKTEWAGLYLINIASSANKKWPWSVAKTELTARRLFEQTYPAIYKHLNPWKNELQNRDDQGKFLWELRSCAYYSDFEVPKIIYPDIAKLMRACYDKTGTFCANTLYIIPTDDLSILGILHGNLFDWYARYNFQPLGDPWKGGRLRFIAEYMGEFPIPPSSDIQKLPIIKLVQTILADPDSPSVPQLETEINHLIYTLYNLSVDEIKLIENSNKINTI